MEVYPNYMRQSLADWMFHTLEYDALDRDTLYDRAWLKKSFNHFLNIQLREVFPNEWDSFLSFVSAEAERTSNVSAVCLQNFANNENATELECILSEGGSAFKVTKTNLSSSEYDKGVYDLEYRVSKSLQKTANQILSNEDLMRQAWHHCYQRKPDYEKTVVDCQNFLEKFLRDKYEPKNLKPQLGKLIGDLKSSPNKLNFKGKKAMANSTIVLELIDKIPSLRGMHTAGTGRKPTKEEAEFVLYTTIYLWNLHQK